MSVTASPVFRLPRCPPQPPQAGFDRRVRHPGRVFKGVRMAGRMGSDTVTTQNVTVHAVDSEKGLILLKGAVPGPGAVVSWSSARPSRLSHFWQGGLSMATTEKPAAKTAAKTAGPRRRRSTCRRRSSTSRSTCR